MSSSKPPKIAEMIIRIITRSGNRSLLLGDLEEDYKYYASEKGILSAKLWYWMQVFTPFHNFIRDQIFWSYFMFKNYLKSAYRNLFKNKIYGAISIFSLAITIGCAVSLFSILHLFFKFDSSHENREDIFMIASTININNEEESWGNTPSPLGPVLKADLSMIKDAVRVTRGNGKMQYGDKVFYESFTITDDRFLDMFTYPLVSGNKNVLSERDAVIITETIALKYFGDEDPIGKQLIITFNNGYKASYFVRGIAKNMLMSTTLNFNILLNFDNLYRSGIMAEDDWSSNISATFIMPENLDNLSSIESKINDFTGIQNNANPDWKVLRFSLEPFKTLFQNPKNIRNTITGSFNPNGPIVFTVIGILLLVLACINYMNVAISSASKRLKEIGLRKVFGSRKSGVVVQFLLENVLVCLLALILGTLLAQVVFFPALRVFGELNIENNIFTTIDVWIIFPAILLFTSVLSGLYPSIFISSYNPVTIFKDNKIKTGKNRFIKALLGFQFIVSFVLLTLSFVVRQNADYQSKLDWGYDSSNMVVVSISSGDYTVLENEIRQNPDITGITGGKDHVGRSSSSANIDYQGNTYEMRKFDVGLDYIETMDINIKEGRNFEMQKSSDLTSAVLVNEEMARQMDWNDPLGEHFKLDGVEYGVIGVVKDFHHYNFMNKIIPMFFRLTDENEFGYLAVRTKEGRSTDTFEYLRTEWKKLIPDEPFSAFYQAHILDDYLRGERNISKLFGLYALVALVISSLGLFGLISLNVLKRIKEIGIRKVLGASTYQVIQIVNKEYVIIMLASSIPAAFISQFTVNSLISMMHEYHLSVSIPHLLFVFSIIVITTFLSIFSLVKKAAKTNPADTLRYE
ncbi:MAG: FtsX-like permease family protein [bacterium]|nr:FtsX-like permease family protein [bacterium]